MKRKSTLFNLLKSFILAFIIVSLINTWLFKSVQVVGNSMYPTLKNGEQGFSSIIHKNVEGLQRFDIVVVKTEKQYLVKRVIGLPNETIEVKDEVLYIDGQFVNQPFLDQDYVKSFKTFTQDFGPITLGEDDYFLMGDNRPVSMDSRFSQYGPFHKDMIISKNIMILYPINEFKWVSQ